MTNPIYKNNDKLSFRTTPIPSLSSLIKQASAKSRRDRSDWIRQSLYIVALCELDGLDVQELLRRHIHRKL